MMARGVVYGVLPQNVKAEGYRVARAHFDYLTAGEIAKRAIGKLYAKKSKKETGWKYAQKNGKKFASELKSYAELYLASSLPYVGECTPAWEFAYPGQTVEESICDSIEVLLNNWGRMLLTIITEIIVKIVLILLLLFVLFISMFIVFERYPAIQKAVGIVAKPAAVSSSYSLYEENAVLVFCVILILSTFLLFINSKFRVRTLRMFFKCADRKPPSGRIYGRFGTLIKKLKKSDADPSQKTEEST